MYYMLLIETTMHYILLIALGLPLFYCILMMGAEVFAPKEGMLSRIGYLVLAVLMTLSFAFMLISGYDLNARKLTWSVGTPPSLYWSASLTRTTRGGELVVPTYLPMLSLIPLFLGLGGGIASRKYSPQAKAKKFLDTAVEQNCQKNERPAST